MIDTIKIAIPLSESQLKKFQAVSMKDGRWQWVQFHPITGEIKFIRIKGLLELDRASFHREIAFDLPDKYQFGRCSLVIELSLPKYEYGHNISLLYDFKKPLIRLKKLLEDGSHTRLLPVEKWGVLRADVCYAWRCPNQVIAQQFLDSLKGFHFPRKRPTIRPTSVDFVGATYSLKFYLKQPEFKHHDRKALMKNKANDEWINHLENLAEGVIRYEVTLRTKYLRRQAIHTVEDLAQTKLHLEMSQELTDLSEGNIQDQLYFYQILLNSFANKLTDGKPKILNLKEISETKNKTLLIDGEVIKLPPINITYPNEYTYEGGSITTRLFDKSTLILQYFLDKFVGHYRGMDTADKVKAKLLERYKTAKVGRLLGFWLHVQRFGTAETKELYGKDIFYRAKADLKAAEVSLIEPTKIIEASARFLDQFQLEIPSPHVVNRVDDFRDSGNLLNLPKIEEA